MGLKLKIIFMGVFAVAVCTALPAFAQQLDWQKEDKGYHTVYTFKWADFSGTPQALSFKVERDTAERAKETDKTFLLTEALNIKYEKAQREAAIRSGNGVSIRPYQAANGNVGYRYSGDQGRAQALVQSIDRRASAAMDDYLQQKNYRLKENGRIESDYKAMAQDNFLEIRPLARAIQKATRGQSMREVMNYTLSFLQSIPYETIRETGDRGNYIFNSPLTLIHDNKGDCDEKSLAFGTLMRLMYPNVDMGLILVPGHAFVAMDIPPQQGDMLLPLGNKTMVVAEPVGPAYIPLGKIHSNSQTLLTQGQTEYRPIPRRF